MSQESPISDSDTRHNKSLGVLATKFVELLKESGSVNLKYATNVLEVQQKRRIYDITNVLEGIGILEKEGKNTVKLKNENLFQTNESFQLSSNQLEDLFLENQELKEQEMILDRELRLIKKSYQQSRKDKTLASYAYITQEDLLDAFSTDESILVIDNPQNLQLEVLNRDSELPSADFLEKLDENCVDLNYDYKLMLKKSDEKLNMKLVEPVINPDIHNIQNVNELMDELKIENLDEDSCEENAEEITSEPNNLNFSAISSHLTIPTLLKRTRTFENLSIFNLDSKEQEELTRKIFTKKSKPKLSKFQKIKNSLRHVKLNKSSFTKVTLPSDNTYTYTLKKNEGVCDLFDIQHQFHFDQIQEIDKNEDAMDIKYETELYDDEEEMEVEYLDEAYLSD